MQSFSLRIWTRVAESISYDDNYYITGTSKQSIKSHFWSLLYDATWDWTPVSRIIGKHFTHYTNNITKTAFEAYKIVLL